MSLSHELSMPLVNIQQWLLDTASLVGFYSGLSESVRVIYIYICHLNPVYSFTDAGSIVRFLLVH